MSSAVDAHLAELADERRAVMQAIRETIRAAAPVAHERIAYGMPALYQRGSFLVSYASYKEHYSLFPASERVRAVLGDEIAPYLAGKGTIRFPAAHPVPLDLVRRVVALRVDELEATGG